MDHCHLVLLLFIVFPLSMTNHLKCSLESNIICDSMGNVTLDTARLYERYKHCDWSSRDKVDTNQAILNPEPSVNVKCESDEIRVKVHCDIPKHIKLLACFKINKNNAKSIGCGAKELIIPVFLWCWVYLL